MTPPHETSTQRETPPQHEISPQPETPQPGLPQHTSAAAGDGAAAGARFPDLDPDTAPPGSAGALTATRRRLGFLPSAVSRMAASPLALTTFFQLSAAFDTSKLSPVQREVVIMTVALRTGCEVCVVMHSGTLSRQGEPELVRRLVAGEPLDGGPLDAVRRFTEAVMTAAGDVSDAAFGEFCDAGFTREQALEVVVGIAAYTLSTYANRLTQAPVDAELIAR